MEDARISVFDSLDELAQKSLRWLTEKTTSPDGRVVSVALPGGNTPQALFECIARLDSGTVDWNRILIFWGDERCVPPDHTESNFRCANRSLLVPLDIPEEHIFRIHGESEPEKEAQRYSQMLAEHLPIVDGFPQFDLILLGLGEDGHTASIFPGDESLFETAAWCTVATHPKSHQKRITLTGSVINHAAEVAFLVTGIPKAEVVSDIVEAPSSKAYPAAKVAPSSGNLCWLLDRGSASGLKR